MNQYSHYAMEFHASQKMREMEAEAQRFRQAREARAGKPSGLESVVQAIGQGLASIGESFKRRENRPSLPAI